MLYNDIYSWVGNFFFLSFFLKYQDIRQGCPNSAMLFLLVAGVLAINIRQNKNISGIKNGDIELKITLMAGDTTLFLADINSLTLAISTFRQFQNHSGLKLNANKTEIILIGKLENKKVTFPDEIAQIQIKHGPLKALGVWYSYSKSEIIELNINRITNIQTIVNIWRSKMLFLKGKITIIKTLIIPQVQFRFSMIFIPDNTLNKIDEMLFEFLWDA